MRRYWLDQDFFGDEDLLILGDLHKHICKVVRHRRGEKIRLTSSNGFDLLVNIEEFIDRGTRVRVLDSKPMLGLQAPFVDLFLSMPKVPVFEEVIEKASEMGVRSITPFFSDHSSIKTMEMFPQHKKVRFESIAKSAAEQSERWPMIELKSPLMLDEALNAKPKDSATLRVFGHERLSADQTLTRLQSDTDWKSLETIELYIGSEGGFSESDVKKFLFAEVVPFSLGSTILKVDTAAICAVAQIRSRLDLEGC